MTAAPLTIVIGAGVSGLACAYALKNAGGNVLLLEASARAGGAIQSVAEDGYLFELGPQSFSSAAALDELCFRLGIADEIVEAPHGASRYVLIEGKLQSVPLSPLAFFMSGLVGWSTKLSILKDLFGKTKPPDRDESIAAFMRRKFTPELLERLVGPFVSGIYAGDPERLSLRAAFPKIYKAELAKGGVLRGSLSTASGGTAQPVRQSKRRPGIVSFKAGNGTLSSALTTALGESLRRNTAVSGLRLTGEGFVVVAAIANGIEEIACKRVVLATPTEATARILDGVAPDASCALRKVMYAPMSVVSLGYQAEQVRRPLQGFGFLVPRSASIRTLGSVWNSSLFPGRAPQGRVLLTSFVGGATDPEVSSLSNDALAALVHREIAPVLGITGNPATSHVTSYSKAIPQYNLGHLDLLRSASEALKAVSGLYVIGNYWEGPSVGACVERAHTVADRIRMG